MMTEIIRSFVAIELPQDLKSQIGEFIKNLKSCYPKVKWINEHVLHVTLKFLGNQPAAIVEKVAVQLMDISGNAGFELNVSGFGAFPNERQPRIFWLGIESIPHQTLYQLFESIEAKLEPLGFEKEKRRFSPHLTIGRVKFQDNFDKVWQFSMENPFRPFRFSVNKIVLMRSILKPSGAVYQPIQKYALNQ